MSEAEKEYGYRFEEESDPFKENLELRKRAYEKVFGTDEGRLVYQDLIKVTGAHRPAGGNDLISINQSIGRQHVGEYLEQWAKGNLIKEEAKDEYDGKLTDRQYHYINYK